MKYLLKKFKLSWNLYIPLIILLILFKLIVTFIPVRITTYDVSYLWYLFSDIPVLGVVFLLVILNSVIKYRYLKLFICFLLFIISLHFYIDVILIYYFQSRAFIPEIFTYLTTEIPLTFLVYWFILFLIFILLIFISSFLSRGIKFRGKDIIAFIIFFVIYLWIFYVKKDKIEFLWNVFTLNSYVRFSNWGIVQPVCESTYNDQLTEETWSWKNLNIILLFLESFSAIDSNNAWGFDHLPMFDKIQNNWIIFKNFLSNGGQSSSAHISTLYWVIPWRKDKYDWYNYIMVSLPKYLNSLWYNTSFISTVSLYFLNQIDFLKWAWFNTIIWDRDIEREYQDAKRYVFNSTPDEYLYKKAIEEIENQTWKFFMWLQTISFHKPYNTPYWATQELALKYSDEKLYEFYEQLNDIWFFNSWILILIWDHRMMNPVQEWEFEKFWESWSSRSVATVVWSWIIAWTINNNIIQHTDIYNSIKKLVWSGSVELDKYYNNIFTNESNRDWSITVHWWSSAWKNRYNIYFTSWDYYSLQTDKLKNINNNDIYEYICSYLAFQDTTNKDILKIH